jgi:hypothetical protein
MSFIQCNLTNHYLTNMNRVPKHSSFGRNWPPLIRCSYDSVGSDMAATHVTSPTRKRHSPHR